MRFLIENMQCYLSCLIFINLLSWLHYGFMWILHKLFHAMFESKKKRFCWCNNISTEAHCDILSVRCISCMICIKICIEEVGLFLILLISSLTDLKKYWCGITLFWKILSWIHYRFMWMVHEIFHVMSESKESGFCWGSHVATDTNGKVLKIIAILNSDVLEATNRVIEGSSMRVFNFSDLLQ